MTGTWRTPTGGRIDRDTPVRFTFNGLPYHGYRGDTLASALLANGVQRCGTSIKHGRPRGIMTAGAEEPNALVRIDEPFAEPMLPATTVRLREGLSARSLAGRGELVTEPDSARYETTHAHCDVLVVGAGPAGLVAALSASRSGARVILAEAGTEFGGSLLGSAESLDDAPAADWVREVTRELAAAPEVRLLQRTTVFGYYEDNYLVALEHCADEAFADQRVWRIRAREVVLATGAHERPLVFNDNDRPGTMLAGAARTYLHRYGVLPGARAVVFTTHDSAYDAAFDLADAGVSIPAVVDGRRNPPARLAQHCAERSIPLFTASAVVGTGSAEHITSARIAPLRDGTANVGEALSVSCDLLLTCGGWNPAVHLHSQSRGTVEYDDALGAFVPSAPAQAERSVGAANGLLHTGQCLASGAAGGAHALRRLGMRPGHVRTPRAETMPTPTGTPLWTLPDPTGAGGDTQFVDLARDSTVADIRRAVGAGMRNVEHVKRYTTIGTAHDQGKTSGTVASGVIAAELGCSISELGTTTFRAPYTSVPFAALAGRERGELYDPVRVTAIHDWHVDRGAHFENVGQWKRPWYYPRSDEDMTAAVLRECEATRECVGIQDVSTLGKIAVRGPDAAEFLDLVYTNMMSTLKVGRIRYGVMCTADGMVFDDGTVLRAAEQDYLITTTSGNAAGVLGWLEDWLQTEWSHLRVYLTSVTDQWATIALAGPRSRDVLSAVTSEIELDNESFPFMSFRRGVVAGSWARVCRISFSGELAFEINVPWCAGRAVWEALMRAGTAYDITPYGTETMHVLRAEKGFPIVGQDTDGTVTPYDLGMSWAVSKKKHDFIGKRSFARVDTVRADREQLVGLLPDEENLLLPEGTQLVYSAELGEPPVPMLGHVTSSYRSAALGRTFALALVKGGRDRIGETIYAPVQERISTATVTEPLFYDKEGARRDG